MQADLGIYFTSKYSFLRWSYCDLGVKKPIYGSKVRGRWLKTPPLIFRMKFLPRVNLRITNLWDDYSEFTYRVATYGGSLILITLITNKYSTLPCRIFRVVGHLETFGASLNVRQVFF